MGIESDRLVLDYLSKVGDLAQATSMSAAERARLVGELRGDIDRRRAAQGGADSDAAVRKILRSMGKPEDVVASASGTTVAVPEPRPSTEAPERSRNWLEALRKSGGTETGKGGGSSDSLPGEPAPPVPAAAPPHLAGLDELSERESNPDWWQDDDPEFGSPTTPTRGGRVEGFTGGIELPELLRPPAVEKEEPEAEGGAGTADGAGPAEGKPAETPYQRLVRQPLDKDGARPGWRRLMPGGTGDTGGPRVGGIVEYLAALILVAGAVTSSLLALGLGWLAAYWSPRLSQNEGKWAALGMPGLVVGATAVWLWGRREGRWGDAIPEGGDAMNDVLANTWPVTLKVAAVASAVFLLWRARRPAP
ncbi:hypothetical protein [Streptomyces sp. NPDC005438]|uniref:hypothetical protein n=1 Tax=Streptomyces sp. NPDC005438 TaxID=3156880 RepID=UPI0033B33C36